MIIAEFTNEQLPDLQILLRRALNTWDKAPAWALELDAKVTARIEALRNPQTLEEALKEQNINFEDSKWTKVL